jgi:methionyl-tRNA formyltransferase
MKIAIVAAGWIGGEAVTQAHADGHEILRVIAPAADDRAALAAQKLGLPLVTFDGRKRVTAADIPDGIEMLLTIGSTAFIEAPAWKKASRAAVGYHPSLLPRHRGIAAVDWTVKMGDPIAGGSIYHLSDGFDVGAVALQDWCFVKPGESAGDLWRRALTPIGLKLARQILAHVRDHGAAPSHPQDETFATDAPRLA